MNTIKSQLLASIDYFFNIALYLIPLFIFATFIVGLIQQYLSDDKIKEILTSQNTVVSHFLASIFGGITPFCSCSTIPILLGLINSGVPFGISMSFLLASPLVNYVAIVLLAALMGWKIAAIYIITTLIATTISGIILAKLDLADSVRKVKIEQDHKQKEKIKFDTLKDNLIFNLKTALQFALNFFVDLFPYLLLGMILGSILHGFVPQEFISTVAGPNNPLAVPIAAIIGAPIYLNIEAMIPIAFALFNLGMSLGAVMALIMGGAGISIPNLVILAKIFKRKLLIFYALNIILIATFIGYVFNIIIN